MTLHVDAIEGVWFLINTIALGVSLKALWDAQVQFKIALAANRDAKDRLFEARLMVARGNRRREFLRAIVQALFVSIVVPLLFTDHPITLNPAIGALIAAAAVLLVSTLYDARDRAQMLAFLKRGIVIDETVAKESSVQENIALTKQLSADAQADRADRADAAEATGARIDRLAERVAASDGTE